MGVQYNSVLNVDGPLEILISSTLSLAHTFVNTWLFPLTARFNLVNIFTVVDLFFYSVRQSVI